MENKKHLFLHRKYRKLHSPKDEIMSEIDSDIDQENMILDDPAETARRHVFSKLVSKIQWYKAALS